MKVSVIIPNYNGADLIQKNLPKIFNAIQGYKDVEIIITDDASTKEEQIMLAGIVSHAKQTSKIPVTLIQHTKNNGFATNVNSGAHASNAEFLLLLNTDVVPRKGFLDPLFEDFKNDPNLFGVGCMDESIEGNRKILRGRGVAFFKRGFLVHSRGEVDKSSTFWISGGSCIVRRDIFEKIGGFDSIYNPFYWEDIDLSYKAQKAGYKVMFERKSVVIHEHAKGSINKHFSQNEVTTIAYRNQIIFVWKNISDPKFIFLHISWLPYHLLRAITSFNSSFLLGFCLALFKLPAIISVRERQKRLWIRRDSEIINK